MIIYGIFPWLDYLFPLDDINPSEQEQKELETKLHFKMPLYVSLSLEWIMCYYIFNSSILHQLTYYNLVGLCLFLGVLATSNINVAHELIHKDNLIDSILGMLTLSKNMYMHF